MGKYINKDSKGNFIGTSFEQKVSSLVEDGAERISPPTFFRDGLICVVDNGHFGAAGYAYDEQEMNEFLYPDNRRRQWLFKAFAENLAE